MADLNRVFPVTMPRVSDKPIGQAYIDRGSVFIKFDNSLLIPMLENVVETGDLTTVHFDFDLKSFANRKKMRGSRG